MIERIEPMSAMMVSSLELMNARDGEGGPSTFKQWSLIAKYGVYRSWMDREPQMLGIRNTVEAVVKMGRVEEIERQLIPTLQKVSIGTFIFV